MSIRATFLLTACALTSVACAQQNAEAEFGFLEKAQLQHWLKDATANASPRFAVVTSVSKERGIFEIAEKIATTVQEKRTVEILGETKIVQPVVKFIIATVRFRYSLETQPVYDVKGKRLEKETVVDRLSVGDVVALSSDGKMLDARYRAALSPQTLILIPEMVAPLHEHELKR